MSWTTLLCKGYEPARPGRVINYLARSLRYAQDGCAPVLNPAQLLQWLTPGQLADRGVTDHGEYPGPEAGPCEAQGFRFRGAPRFSC